MKKIVLTIMSMLVAAVSFAQIVQVGAGELANTFNVNVIFFKAVDLGLSSGTKWANMNVGATCPADYGAYFMWGYTTDCSDVECSDSICKTYGVEISDWQGNLEYDAAAVNWGDNWVTPNSAQIQELRNDCDWEWTTQQDSKGNQVNGYIVTGTNGNSIFLPAAGYRDGANVGAQESDGYYLSSSPSEGNTTKNYYLRLESGNPGIYLCNRYYGFSVRPVLGQ